MTNPRIAAMRKRANIFLEAPDRLAKNRPALFGIINTTCCITLGALIARSSDLATHTQFKSESDILYYTASRGAALLIGGVLAYWALNYAHKKIGQLSPPKPETPPQL